jgi:hypothetical protein
MAIYHLSMGYIWPKNPTTSFTGALLTGAVQLVNNSPTVSNFNSLNDNDQILFYVYDLASSGTTPSPATPNWISITPQGSDLQLFDQSITTLNTGATLSGLTPLNMFSQYFQLTVPCYQINLPVTGPLEAVVEQNTQTTSGPFSVIVTITVSDGNGNTGTYTSYDPTMIVNPG